MLSTLHKPAHIGFLQTPRDFNNALKELDSNFTATEKSRDRVVIRFHNPSVRDFLLNYLKSSEEELKLLIDSCVFFNQLTLLWNIDDRGTPMFRDAIKKDHSSLIAAIKRTFDSADCELMTFKDSQGSYKNTWSVQFETRTKIVTDIATTVRNAELEVYLTEKLLKINDRMKEGKANRDSVVDILKTLKGSKLLDPIKYRNLLDSSKEFLTSAPWWIGDFEAFVNFAELFPELIYRRDWRKVRVDFNTQVNETIKEILDRGGTSGSWAQTQSFYIRKLSKQLRVPPPRRFKNVEAYVESWEMNQDALDSVPPVRAMKEDCPDSEIESMFRILEN